VCRSALLSTDWIQYTAPGATEPSEISTPEQTMILVILALLLGISGLFAMLLRFFKRHPRRTIIVALVFVILGALCIILAVSTAELFAIQVIPDGATDVVAGFGAVSLFISCPLATVSAVMLAIDYKFGKVWSLSSWLVVFLFFLFKKKKLFFRATSTFPKRNAD